ncbi:MAG TPA: hypothetical protein VGX23_35725 [Actinocrinis sp.]|nr:hypothetical protein [Actinocrinis sp.]
MTRFEITALKDSPSTITFQFGRYRMQDDAEYIDSVIADPRFLLDRDGVVLGDIPDLTVDLDEHLVEFSRPWMLSVCFRHLREHGGMTNHDSFVFTGWRRYPIPADAALSPQTADH